MPDFESYPCEISTTSREDFTFVGIYFGEWRPVIKFRFPRISSYIRILCYPLYMCMCVCVCKTGLSHFFFFLYCLDVIRQVSWLWAWERKRGKIIPPLLRFFFCNFVALTYMLRKKKKGWKWDFNWTDQRKNDDCKLPSGLFIFKIFFTHSYFPPTIPKWTNIFQL